MMREMSGQTQDILQKLPPDVPHRLVEYFCRLCEIPHGSGNEGAVADFLCAFAAEHGLEAVRDEHNNVLIVREGDVTHPPVLLQGHTDMVCEKNADTVFDFENEGLRLQMKGEWLSACGTTLGADDGVAVAIMMHLLADEDRGGMPTIECLFTTDEERGMTGAMSFDYSRIRSRTVINLDSEEEGSACVSCAGGTDYCVQYPCDTVKAVGTPLDLTVSGLAGGHSGADINDCRANAVLLAGEILHAAYETMPFNLADMQAEGKRNAIPRECVARVVTADADLFRQAVEKATAEITSALAPHDRKLRVRVQKTKTADRRKTVLSFRETSRVLAFLTLVPNGPLTFSFADHGLVESSSNLATVRRTECGMEFGGLARSSVQYRMERIKDRISSLCRELGMDCSFFGEYPGWEYRAGTPLQEKYLRVYRELFGREAKLVKIHAGVECGLVVSALGDCDCISIGPQIEHIHTPAERLSVPSFARTYRLVLALLKV